MAKNQKKVADKSLNTYPKLDTWSARIRAMFADGVPKADIARALGKRYQHVRNVLITPLKRDQEASS